MTLVIIALYGIYSTGNPFELRWLSTRIIMIIIINNNKLYNNNNKTMVDSHMAPASQPSSQQSMNVESENPKLSKFWHAILV